jgi:hypothetical protein
MLKKVKCFLNTLLLIPLALICIPTMALGSVQISGTTTISDVQSVINSFLGLPPATITSAGSTTFTIGTAGTFTATGTGTITVAGILPSGLTFNAATGVLSGTPATGTNATYPLTVMATNKGFTVTQAFTLTVNPAAVATQSGFTMAMLSGKTYNYHDTDPNANNGQGDTGLGMTFNTDGTYSMPATKLGTWSINTSGQLVTVETDGSVDTITLTDYSGTVIAGSDYYVPAGSQNGSPRTFAATLTVASPSAFSMAWLSGKTLYQVWFGDGFDANNNKIPNVPVVVGMTFASDGTFQGTKILNSADYSGTYGVTSSGMLYAQGDSTQGNTIITGSTADYVKTKYTINGVIDNIDLFFLDKNAAIAYANTLTSGIPTN